MWLGTIVGGLGIWLGVKALREPRPALAYAALLTPLWVLAATAGPALTWLAIAAPAGEDALANTARITATMTELVNGVVLAVVLGTPGALFGVVAISRSRAAAEHG